MFLQDEAQFFQCRKIPEPLTVYFYEVYLTFINWGMFILDCHTCLKFDVWNFLFYIVDICYSNPCGNGECTESEDRSGYICTCHFGYTGKNCDEGAVC